MFHSRLQYSNIKNKRELIRVEKQRYSKGESPTFCENVQKRKSYVLLLRQYTIVSTDVVENNRQEERQNE